MNLDLRDSAKMRQALEPALAYEREFNPGFKGKQIYQRGQYDFRELLMWRSALKNWMFVEGAGSLSIYHQKNRVQIGVVSNAAIHAMREFARGQNVPDDALLIVVETPMRPMSDARSDSVHLRLGRKHKGSV